MPEKNQAVNLIKTLFLIIVPPGIMFFLIPYLIVTWGKPEPSIWMIGRFLAIATWSVGAVLVIYGFKDFVVQGQGTPAPNDPPKDLVVHGLYKNVRNPMYLGIVLILIGHFLWFQARWLLLYALGMFFVFHVMVTLFEEPGLVIKFGEPYQHYRQVVPRWLPRFFK